MSFGLAGLKDRHQLSRTNADCAPKTDRRTPSLQLNESRRMGCELQHSLVEIMVYKDVCVCSLTIEAFLIEKVSRRTAESEPAPTTHLRYFEEQLPCSSVHRRWRRWSCFRHVVFSWSLCHCLCVAVDA
jgi:hypothetical protein